LPASALGVRAQSASAASSTASIRLISMVCECISAERYPSKNDDAYALSSSDAELRTPQVIARTSTGASGWAAGSSTCAADSASGSGGGLAAGGGTQAARKPALRPMTSAENL
jgi:hypothetical protein